MTENGEHHPAPANGAGFNVVVVRDPGDNLAVCVEWGRDDPAEDGGAGLNQRHQVTRALAEAIQRDGRPVQYCFVARGLASRALALTVQEATVAALRFGAPTVTVVPMANHEFARDRRGQDFHPFDSASAVLATPDSSDDFLDVGHRGRLEQLILQQTAEMAQLQAALDRVRALRDLAEWADRLSDSTQPGATVRTSDLTQALGDVVNAERPSPGAGSHHK
jgi:hypothetical protein